MLENRTIWNGEGEVEDEVVNYWMRWDGNLSNAKGEVSYQMLPTISFVETEQ